MQTLDAAEIERIRRRVRLRDLETLAAVVAAGGMHRAARTLHLSQPAVSKAIAELEAALGLRLLERSRRGVVATPHGDALVRHAQAIVDAMRIAMRELAHLSDPEGGEVRLGCMETLHAGLVGAAVAETVGRSPRVRFTLESGQAGELVEHFLLGRAVDAVIARPHSPSLPAGVVGEALFSDQLLVVVGSSHPLARRRKLRLAELAGEPWILSRNEASADSPVGRAFASEGLPSPARCVLSGSLHTRSTLLATGRFVTCVPHSLLPYTRERAFLRVLPVELPRWHVPTMILTLQGRPLPAATGRFLDRVRELAEPLRSR